MPIKTYYHLTKPGIIYGNALTAAAGFLLASKGHIHVLLLLAMLVGLSLIIGSSCAFNNMWDADIDAKMARTKKRAMVTGEINKTSALIFASVLGLLGAFVLYFYTNLLTLAVALVGMFFYLILYTPLKRRTVYGTLIGAVAGATPPVVGYVAVTNHLDAGALLLFFILVFWQMPHFYAIAIRRMKDYADAGIPVLPVKTGIQATKIHMVFYIVGFVITSAMLTVYGYAGYMYLAVILLLGLTWLFRSAQGFKTGNDELWARKMFLFSLIVLTSLCVIIPIDIAVR